MKIETKFDLNQIVYAIKKDKVLKCVVEVIYTTSKMWEDKQIIDYQVYDTGGQCYIFRSNLVFSTKEEAEQKLKEIEK